MLDAGRRLGRIGRPIIPCSIDGACYVVLRGPYLTKKYKMEEGFIYVKLQV